MSTTEYRADGFGSPWRPKLRAALAARALSREGWIVVGLVLVAAAIRFAVIDNQSFWADEALTAYESRIRFGAMINVVLHVETTPPLYFVLIWAWGHVLGTGEVALRSLSTLAGVAVVPIAYLCGCELASRRAGVIAAAFVAVNPFLIWYSQEARAYMLLVALSGASFLWFARARREPSRRNVAWWTAWSSLALMTHFFAGFLVAAEALWLLWTARTRLIAGALAVVAIVEAAMVPFALLDTGHGPGWIAAEPRVNRVSQAISEWGTSILYRRTPIALGLIAGTALVAIVTLLAVFGGDRRTRDAVRVGALVVAFVWVAPLALHYLGQDYFLSRNVMPAVVPLVVAIAAACAAPRARLLGGALAAALLAMFAFAAVRVQSHRYLERPNWEAVARALGSATVPRAIFAADGTTADPLKIYLPHAYWSMPVGRRFRIREIDVVGATKRLGLLTARPTEGGLVLKGALAHPVGASVPRSIAPRGARLIARFRVQNWVLARFALRRPIRVSIEQLTALAPRFFRRAPRKLLVFFQSVR
jgi:4-amino-4-deoxy-L-arabinose transferase-like glycosyltransferase